MAEYKPEGKATKWSLLTAYNPDSAELNKVEELYMEDTTKGLLVANYVWDYTALEWVKATQTTLTTDILYLALDDVEGLLTDVKTAVEIIDNFISGNRGLVTEDNSAAIKAAVEIMDDWDESNRAKVNPIVGQAGVAAGAGAVGVTVQRVTVASDDPLLVETQDNLQDYFLDDIDKSGDPIYIGYQDKGGNYYIQRYNKSTGAVDYTKGASNYSTAWTNRATESYDEFSVTF